MRLLLVIMVLGMMAAAPQFAGPVAQAQDGEIQVVDQGAESRFPDGIRFHVTAESPDEINDIRVHFKQLGQTTRSGYRRAEFSPGPRVTVEAVIQSGTSAAGFIPPGTEVAYSFEIRDAAGRVHRTEEQSFIYLDSRFQWESISQGMVTVHYDGPEARDRAEMVLRTAGETLETMGPVLGIDISDRLRIVMYSSYADMRDALPFQSQATEEQLITEGQAFSEARVLLVLGSGDGVRGTTAHEFTHLLVAEAAGRAISQVPSWLNEGLAEYGNPEPSPSYGRALEFAIENGLLRPLWHQHTFSGTPQDVIIGYGQGQSVVEYLAGTYGEEKIGEVFEALQSTLDIDRALEEVYGFDQHGLDSRWRESLGLEPLSPSATSEAQGQATPSPTSTPSPTATAEPQTDQSDTPTPENNEQVSPGCGAAAGEGGLALADPALLALLAGPLALAFYRKQQR